MSGRKTGWLIAALIALETGVVADENELIPYGGEPMPIDEWERDMGLRDAVRVSNLPVFQELARRIGPRRERRWMRRLEYGNAAVGSAIDRFWVDGPPHPPPERRCFALNMDIESDAHVEGRVSLGKALLRRLGAGPR